MGSPRTRWQTPGLGQLTNQKQFHPSEGLPEQAEVTLSGRDLEEARRLFALLAGASGRLPANNARPPAGRTINAQVLAARARQILEARQQRTRIFGRAMFGEPAWEMLLLLYVSQSGSRQTVTRLAEGSGASKGTALRWLDYLLHQNLVRREPHPTDRRAAFVELTEKGRLALDKYLSEMNELSG